MGISVREKSTENQTNVEDQQSDAKGPRTNGEDAQPNEHLLKERLIKLSFRSSHQRHPMADLQCADVWLHPPKIVPSGSKSYPPLFLAWWSHPFAHGKSATSWH